MFLYIFGVLTFYYILKPLRSALFLSELPASDLPKAYLLTALIAGPLVTLVFKLSPAAFHSQAADGHKYRDHRVALRIPLGNWTKPRSASLRLLRLRPDRLGGLGGAVLATGRIHLRQPAGEANLWRAGGGGDRGSQRRQFSFGFSQTHEFGIDADDLRRHLPRAHPGEPSRLAYIAGPKRRKSPSRAGSRRRRRANAFTTFTNWYSARAISSSWWS